MSSTELAARPIRPQWIRAARWPLRAMLYLAMWFWPIAFAIMTVVLLIASRSTDVELSAVQYARHASTWFPFSMAIVMTTVQLPLCVTRGMTRRSFARAALAVAALTGLLYSVVVSAALVVERAVYNASGWYQGEDTSDGPEILRAGIATVFAGHCVTFVAATFSGLLVAITYYRFGPYRGTIALPLTMLPILAVMSIGTGSTQWEPITVPPALDAEPSTPVATLISLAILAATAYVFHLLTRRIPINT